MAERKKLLLRLDPRVYDAIAKWAADDIRSVNAQIEFALRLALRAAGRTVRPAADAASVEPASHEGAASAETSERTHEEPTREEPTREEPASVPPGGAQPPPGRAAQPLSGRGAAEPDQAGKPDPA